MSAADSRHADEYFRGMRPELRSFLKLPPAEPPKGVRARMAEFLQHRVAADGSVTREQLEGAGFSEREIRDHFHPAKRIARLVTMVA